MLHVHISSRSSVTHGPPCPLCRFRTKCSQKEYNQRRPIITTAVVQWFCVLVWRLRQRVENISVLDILIATHHIFYFEKYIVRIYNKTKPNQTGSRKIWGSSQLAASSYSHKCDTKNTERMHKKKKNNDTTAWCGRPSPWQFVEGQQA